MMVDVVLLDELYNAPSEQYAAELALRIFEQRLCGLDFADVDMLLGAADVARLAPPVVLAILAITRPAKCVLRMRDAFVGRAEASLRARLGQERADRLMEHRR